MRVLLTLAALTLASSACTSNDLYEEFTGPVVLGGEEVSAATLNVGREAYIQNCYACHGLKGDGNGPSAKGLRPPPRDFTSGLFKFGKVFPQDALPHDEDLRTIVVNGLAGTAMLQWDVPDGLIHPILQYIKTFSPVWQDPDEEIGERIDIAAEPDPWARNKKEAIARGKVVYHGDATCQQCHAAYATRAEIYAAGKQAGKSAEFRDNMYYPELRESEVGMGEIKLKILPPDFFFHEIRSGTSVDELYRTIAAGVKPTMPPWYQALDTEDLWAMAHYVRSLIDMRGTPKATELRDMLMHQPEFTPPADDGAAPPPSDAGGAATPPADDAATP